MLWEVKIIVFFDSFIDFNECNQKVIIYLINISKIWNNNCRTYLCHQNGVRYFLSRFVINFVHRREKEEKNLGHCHAGDLRLPASKLPGLCQDGRFTHFYKNHALLCNLSLKRF